MTYRVVDQEFINKVKDMREIGKLSTSKISQILKASSSTIERIVTTNFDLEAYRNYGKNKKTTTAKVKKVVAKGTDASVLVALKAIATKLDNIDKMLNKALKLSTPKQKRGMTSEYQRFVKNNLHANPGLTISDVAKMWRANKKRG